MLKFLLLFFYLFTDIILFAQNNTNQYNKIAISTTGEVILYNSTLICKLNTDKSISNQFSSQRYGAINSVDATNPYKIIVFYKNHNGFQILDNKLKSIIDFVDFADKGYYDVNIICGGHNNTIIIYDSDQKKIYTLTDQLFPINSSITLNNIIDSDKIQIDHISNNKDLIFCSLKNIGALLFDNNCTYIKTITIQGAIKTRKINNNGYVYEHEDGTIRKLSENLLNESIITKIIPKDWELFNNKIFLLNNDSIEEISLLKE